MTDNKQWRQKWELISDGKNTKQFFHTWHESEEIALEFVGNYFSEFKKGLPAKYYRPFGLPALKCNKSNEPEATFICAGFITLVPI
ncbi:MAG TPA: hypothetical protein PKD79_00770 [Candidatus Doudnabacteria bacterium]|nr:hypothetical protein [Candidatus Doudnabacteria bacterium]